MKIIKKINNNVALAVDVAGKEVVVFGKGIGFPAMPYELDDPAKIQRTFYDIKVSYVEVATSLPEDVLLLAADIYEMAQAGLACKLNPNMPFTLADHLSFAIERYACGMQLSTPLSYDVAHFFPAEVSLGRRALEMVNERKGVCLPENEAVNIALHLVNNEMENSDMHATLKAAEVIRDITQIIERVLRIRLNTSSFNYARFVMHIRYLLQRMEQDNQEQNGMSMVMRQLCIQYPDIYRCTLAIQEYLHKRVDRRLSQDEMLYLFMHLNRLNERSQKEEETKR